MDPLAHSLVGLALAETPVARWASRGDERLGIATAACLLGANAPDVDVVAYFVSSDFALEHRRGWTHGALAWVVLPLVLTAALLLWQRWRRGGLSRLAPRGLLALSFVALATHPFLDWLNTYGVRLLAPFDWRWFYGDAAFIVDPWMWLLPGGAVFLVHRWRWRGLAGWAVLAVVTSLLVLGRGSERIPDGMMAAKVLWVAALAALVLARSLPTLGNALVRHRERVATAALTLTLLYVGTLVASAQVARGWVARTLSEEGLEVGLGRDELMVGPRPITPFRRDVVADAGDAWRVGTFRWWPSPHLEAVADVPKVLPAEADRRWIEETLDEALADPAIRGLTTWVRFPFYRIEEEIEEEGGVRRVWVLDARYTRSRTEGFGGGRVEIGPDRGPGRE